MKVGVAQRNFKTMEHRALELDFVARKPVWVLSFGKLLKQSVKYSQVLCHAIPKCMSGRPAREGRSFARMMKTAGSPAKVKVFGGKFGKTRVRSLKAVARCGKQRERLLTLPEKVGGASSAARVFSL